MRWVFLLILLILSNPVFCQNLIPNPDFEDYSTCPSTYTKRLITELVPNWVPGKKATPDYFNGCSKLDAGVPYNWAGIAYAQSGEGYAGLLMYELRSNYSESLETSLIEPLRQGEKYLFEFYYSLADYSIYMIDEIQVKFTLKEDYYILSYPLNMNSVEMTFNDWHLISDTIIAKGGEKSIGIGVFKPKSELSVKKLGSRVGKEPLLIDKGYYYIDNFYLADLKTIPSPIIQEYDTGRIYTFQNVLFEFDKSDLKEDARSELYDIVSYLYEHDSLSIFIGGHTDESGSEEYNLALSKQRAKSVADFLIFSGISPNRVEFKGFGESSPIEKTGRKSERNRRVEFRFFTEKDFEINTNPSEKSK